MSVRKTWWLMSSFRFSAHLCSFCFLALCHLVSSAVVNCLKIVLCIVTRVMQFATKKWMFFPISISKPLKMHIIFGQSWISDNQDCWTTPHNSLIMCLELQLEYNLNRKLGLLFHNSFAAPISKEIGAPWCFVKLLLSLSILVVNLPTDWRSWKQESNSLPTSSYM